MCGQHNVSASAGNNTDRTQTKDAHPIPGQKLKFMTPPGIESGLPGWKAVTLPTMPRRRIFPNIYMNEIQQRLTNVIYCTYRLMYLLSYTRQAPFSSCWQDSCHRMQVSSISAPNTMGAGIVPISRTLIHWIPRANERWSS